MVELGPGKLEATRKVSDDCMIMNCAMRSLFSIAAMLAANEVCAFVTPGGLGPLAVRSITPAGISPVGSRRFGKQEQVDVGSGEAGSAGDKKSGPFSSWLKKAAGRLPFSRAAKNKDEVDDLLNSDAFLTKKVQILQKRIEATREETKEAELEAEKQWEEWGPQVTRLEKEFQLVKSRGGEVATKAYDKGKADVLNNILGVADNFERAAAAITPETDGEKAVAVYYKDVYDAMITSLEGLGLKEVEMVGAPFDFNIHNAIMREATDEFDEDVVCKVFQKGYRVGDMLVRPAMVAVASN